MTQIAPRDWAAVAPPDGFRWVVYPRNPTSKGRLTWKDGPIEMPIDMYVSKMNGLRKWAYKHKVDVRGRYALWGNYDHTVGDNCRFTEFVVYPNVAWTARQHSKDIWANRTAPLSHVPCRYCQMIGVTVHDHGCPMCVRKCTGCNTHVPKGHMLWAVENGNFVQLTNKCTSCTPARGCSDCGYKFPVDDIFMLDRGPRRAVKPLCPMCKGNYMCADCGGPMTPDGECITCAMKGVMEKAFPEGLEAVKPDPAELPVHGCLSIEKHPERQVRIVSIETEMESTNKTTLALALHEAGIIPNTSVAGYHEHPDLGSDYPAFLKYDGSVASGGELISWLIDPSDSAQAMALERTMCFVRHLEKRKIVKFKSNCGGHIHVDAHNFGNFDLWRLLLAWGYIEDAVFRLAGAGSPYGHRTLDPGHDVANGGRGYSKNVIKGPWNRVENVLYAARNQARMSALNFVPYWEAVPRCECGAVMNGDPKNCTCNLGKCTIEFRVFNSTANLKILHAWIAFIQAIMSWASRDDETVTPEFEEQFLPTNDWSQQPWTALTWAKRERTRKSIRWMFENLPFTESERDSMIYAFKQSDVDITPEFETELRGIKRVIACKTSAVRPLAARRKKKPRLSKGDTTAAEVAAARNPFDGGVEPFIRFEGVYVGNANVNANPAPRDVQAAAWAYRERARNPANQQVRIVLNGQEF